MIIVFFALFLNKHSYYINITITPISPNLTLSQSEIKDLHSSIDVNIYDEDRDRKNEFLGRVLIPVLTVS